MEMEEVCYTKEGALKKAIEMEQESFDTYLMAYRCSQDRRARTLIKELALEELEHKYTLEKAFFEETVILHEDPHDSCQSMKFTLFLQDKPLDVRSSPQDIMIHAIHEEKRSVDFYEKMASQCSGAPMEPVFRRLYQDEACHLSRLEALYESIYMKEM